MNVFNRLCVSLDDSFGVVYDWFSKPFGWNMRGEPKFYWLWPVFVIVFGTAIMVIFDLP